ncbi:MAG: ParB/RepB/Spo0J family partition protein [Ruminococcaceae bacterium]|nr:ParB/RepB/Spo0J family partition protein [Oscillospiraceae bacterium]
MSRWFKNCFSEYYSEKKEENGNEEKAELGRIYLLPVEKILPNRSQPRKNFSDEAILSLADSIKQYGILQPLTVRCCESLGVGEYELVAGERRLRAARVLGMTKVPCIVINADDERSATLAIIENLQREDLDMFETAEALLSLMELHRMTQEEIASMLSVSQSYIANKIRILRLNTEERSIILSNGLSERHARAVLKLEDEKGRVEALRHIAEKKLNVSEAEKYVEESLYVEKRAKKRGKGKFVIKDIRIFYNTIEKAIATVHKAGIGIEKEEKEGENGIELIIRIPKAKERGT